MKKQSTNRPDSRKPVPSGPSREENGLSLFPGTDVESWIDEDGQLSVDVLETDGEIVIRSAIAGVRPEDLEVSVHNDLLTIRGQRKQVGETAEGRWLVRECHWGGFSRSLILPTEVDPDRIRAELKDGILTVRMPKAVRDRKIKVQER
ncbi:Hsp20/alpha crystallin family protein [Candidatus Uhrbacteria bacterium]|nr:Hsp20/alpha crystallin family protein [Candidatus Uhrbacteria bacterium]